MKNIKHQVKYKFKRNKQQKSAELKPDFLKLQ